MSTSPIPIIRLEDLTKAYVEGSKTRLIFDKVNATFYQGELALLLGQSGSGKSTLLNLISGIDAPDGGDVFINGVAINRLSEHERTLFRREHIGFVFQFFNLIPTLTVFENVTLPSQLKGQLSPEKTRQAENLLEQVGLADRRDTFPDRLSGGEQQRIAILRALLHDPTVLLADEPTGNLDEATGQRVIDLLLALTRQLGKTMLMVTHNSDLIPLADRVFRVTNGQIIEE
jgi:putative ABC transport system ATP-binding protein